MPILCEIVTQERLVYSSQADMIIVDGSEGRMGILPNHAPLLTTLKISELRVKSGDIEEVFALGGGVLEVRRDRVTVLADVAEHADEIDLERAQDARERAEIYLSKGKPVETNRDVFREITQALRKANIRLRVSAKRRGISEPMDLAGSN